MCVRFYSWLMVALALMMSSGQAEDVSGLSTNKVVTDPLDFSPVFNENTLLRSQFDPDYSLGMRRVNLTDRRVTCNDGSPAGYYIRKTPGSRRWIIFLEGGYYCSDYASCVYRWEKSPYLMSSKNWTDIRHVGGILSPNSDENPYWWNSNHVLVPYCSSDSWSGATGPDPGASGYPWKLRFNFTSDNFSRLSFMGSYIVSQVVSDLLPRGLTSGTKLILAGSSAGGIGVMLNLDRVADFLRESAPRLDVRGLSDSGWFIDRAPFPNSPDSECREQGTCKAGPATMVIQRAMNFWDAQVPENCALQHPHEKWRCFFGQSVYPSIKTPLFIFQWLFDEVQIAADNVGPPTTRKQWNYIYAMGQSLRKSMQNVTSFFVPPCISHTVLTSKDWRHVQINMHSLPEVLACWELQLTDKVANKHLFSPLKNKHQPRHRHGVPRNSTLLSYMLADQPAETRKIVTRTNVDLSNRRIKGKKNRCKRNRKNKEKDEQDGNGNGRKGERRCQNKNKKNRDNKRDKLNQRNNGGKKRKDQGKNSKRDLNYNNRRGHRSLNGQCKFRDFQSCSWPQCSLTCPKLYNPYTGEGIDFLDLLKSFGMSMDTMLNAFGVDEDTLHNMEHKDLLNMLTQKEK
ncbi:palmitoleoyl-protein carboxylesterase NOTUM [Cloeon dipterum]|uniref:palmitoleoyl-protein carboxylesterase NOTUM n=1 Tax=Cloeon dipterum TaxID=197152 RepID=UPI00321FEDA4